ncbi:alpha-ketoglutarate-dependent dioxygenase AlkB [Actinokineospora xionganensis]|uniref:Alpha-ketoglutarate-dependent dioxygenase AlkB n=1 Tax=Actinokineospora xionganensis TaxID=2684470 RepID=A0ABR7LAZ2_9PSEU|nr:alpha-ketoglutarate-dependent dioxygenase AlkB [Actinokineospora xionganensis]MBC6449861.1 alpha-ketoglutarate-dependent dioxygenase AlkB [Actinokineospora xionganensis]
MSVALQGSLWDTPETAGFPPLSGVRRVPLSDGAWLDLFPGWLPGADDLFDRLVDTVPWKAERRKMYDSVVDVPRLLCHYREGATLPDAALTQARDALNEHYHPEHFATAGLCFYRDGHDSVAWHGDRIGRGATEDTMVAIVSVGAPRALMLRPRGGGHTLRHEVGHGDLLVMGGSCQRTWEHAVPKTSKPVGPRISIQFRPRGVL